MRPAITAPIQIAARAIGYGVPGEWLADVRGATEDTLLTIADHLPAEASEALLELATGGTPKAAPVATPQTNPFDHPDAQRRFRVMTDAAALAHIAAVPGLGPWTAAIHLLFSYMGLRIRSDGQEAVEGAGHRGAAVVGVERQLGGQGHQPKQRAQSLRST